MSNGLTEREKRETIQVAWWLTAASFVFMAILLVAAALVLSDDRLDAIQRQRVVGLTGLTLIVFAVILCFRLGRLLRRLFY